MIERKYYKTQGNNTVWIAYFKIRISPSQFIYPMKLSRFSGEGDKLNHFKHLLKTVNKILSTTDPNIHLHES